MHQEEITSVNDGNNSNNAKGWTYTKTPRSLPKDSRMLLKMDANGEFASEEGLTSKLPPGELFFSLRLVIVGWHRTQDLLLSVGIMPESLALCRHDQQASQPSIHTPPSLQEAACSHTRSPPHGGRAQGSV